MDLIYSGHAAEGRKLIEKADAFYTDMMEDEPPLSQQVMEEVARSPFGREILALSHRTDLGVGSMRPATQPATRPGE